MSIYQSFQRHETKIDANIGVLTEPDFYIIDEPFIGLDPVATKEFLNYLYKEKSAGRNFTLYARIRYC